MSKVFYQTFLYLIVSLLVLSHRACCDCDTTEWVKPSSNWCVGPTSTVQDPSRFLQREVDSLDDIVGVTLLPVNNPSLINHFLRGFMISYTNNADRTYWQFYKEKESENGATVVKVFPGMSATDMDSAGNIPTIYLRDVIGDLLQVRLHPLTVYPLNGPCMSADLHYTNCDNTTLPTFYPPPYCNYTLGFELYGRCRIRGDRTFVLIEEAESDPDIAQSVCVKMGSNLASLHSYKDMTLLTDFLTSGTDFILGLQRTGVGEYKYWMDDTEVDFVAWSPGQPSYDVSAKPFISLNMNQDGLWASSQPTPTGFVCQTSPLFPRRLVGGYYRAAVTHLSSGKYITKGSHSLQFRNSLDNAGRYGQTEHFYDSYGAEIYVADVGYKPVLTHPLHINGPYMQVIFDIPMIIDSVLINNNPSGTASSNKFIIKYGYQNRIVTYKQSGVKKVIEIVPGTGQPTLTLIYPPITTHLVSVSMVSSGEAATKITWDVMGYPAVDVHTVDICELADHGCTQKCLPTLTSYKCACNDSSYHLMEDDKTCIHNSVCLSSYEKIGAHCYRIVTDSVSYSAAASSCASDGTTLTSIHTHDQFELLRRKLVDSPSSNFFIGLHGRKLLQERWDDYSWLDMTFFVPEVPDELPLEYVVYLDKDYSRAWNYGPESTTTAGYICKQLVNHCTIPQLAGPFPVSYSMTASSGSTAGVPFNTPNMAVFQHNPNTPHSSVRVEVLFDEVMTVTGFVFSSGDKKGVKSFKLYYRNDSIYQFQPVMDRLEEAAQVFTLMSPPSTLAYYWITAINASNVRLEYLTPGSSSQRVGLAMEIFGCPLENGSVPTSHYCDEDSIYHRRFPDHPHEFHCVRDCGGFWVDNTITCDDAAQCSATPCFNEGVCYESAEGIWCDCPEGRVDGTNCASDQIKGLSIVGSKTNVSNTEEFYVVVFLEEAPGDNQITMDFDDDFSIEVKADMLDTLDNTIANNPFYNLSFVNASQFENQLCYVMVYSYIHIGMYNITVTAKAEGREDVSAYWEVYMTSDNPCPTAIIISNLFSDYAFRLTYISSVEIMFMTGVDRQCRYEFVMSRIWEWKMFMLTDLKPEPEASNRVQLPKNIATDEPTLVLPKDTLSPGLYHVQARLNLTIAPSEFKVSANSSGFVVVVEPAVHVSIVGGTARQVFVGRSQDVVAVVSSFFFDDRVSAEIINRFNWSCNAGINETCDFVSSVWPEASADSIYIPVDGPEFTLPAFALTIDKTYTLTVYMVQLGFGNVQIKVYKQQITAINAEIPDLIIKCEINCGQTVQAGEKLTLVAFCVNCGSPDELVYKWDFKALEERFLTQKIIWEVDTGTNSTEDVLVIKADVLTPDEAYLVSVNGTTADDITGYAELAFATTPSIIQGQCYISPSTGYALKTEFRISCRNFISETDMIYFVYMSLYKEHDFVWHFLSASYTPVLNIEMLPRGIKTGYIHHLLLYVMNQALKTVYFIMKVRVLPLGVITDSKLSTLIFGKTDDDISDLDYALMLNIPFEVTELMTSMVPELNAVTAATGSTGPRIEMREKLIRVLSQTDSSNDNLIQPMSYLVDELLKTNKLTVSEDMIENSANLTATLTERYTDFLKTASPGQGEKTAEFLLGGISRLRNTVRTQAAYDIQQAGNKSLDSLTRRKELSDDTIQEQKSVLEKLAKHKYPGEEVSRFVGDAVVFMVRRDTPLSLNKEKVLDRQKSQGGVSIPWNLKVLTGEDMSEVITQVIITEYDPFPWGETELGAPVNQTSVSVSLISKEQGAIELTDLDTPMEVLIPVNKNEGTNKWTDVFTMRVYYDSYSGEIVKNLSRPMGFSVLCQPGFSAFVKIDLGHVKMSLSVLIKAGIPVLSYLDFFEDGSTVVSLPKDPSLLDTGGIMPENDKTIFLNMNDYNTIQGASQSDCVPSGNITCDDTPATNETPLMFYIAFIPDVSQNLLVENWPGVCYNPVCNISAIEVEVTVTAVSMACVYWDEERQLWTNQGCVSTRLSTPDQIHCYCDRLQKISFFSASIFVLPNKLDPIGDFGLFLTFFENPLVVSLVICIWLYYFILLIWARHRDKQDTNLAGVTVLADNDPGNTYLYLIGVTTGWWRDAHTTARVFMFVDGTEGQSFRHALYDERIKRFSTGAVDWFVMATSECLGELESVTVWHDNTGDSPAWFLKCVVVHDISTHRTWTFIHNDWLALDRSPRQVMVRLPSFSSREIQKNSTHQFFAKWTHDMRDGHLWFSIFAKPLQSSFTRVQRLSCALVLLLSAMLTNIMFYGIPTDEPEDRLTAQGLVISVPLIVIGIETALVMFLINFIIVNLFILVRPRDRAANQEDDEEKDTVNSSPGPANQKDDVENETVTSSPGPANQKDDEENETVTSSPGPANQKDDVENETVTSSPEPANQKDDKQNETVINFATPPNLKDNEENENVNNSATPPNLKDNENVNNSAARNPSAEEADKDSSQDDAARNPSSEEADKDSSQDDAARNLSAEEADKDSSQDDAARNPSAEEADKDSSQDDAARNPSAEEADKDSSQDDAARNPSAEEADKDSSQDGTARNPSAEEADKDSSQDDADRHPSAEEAVKDSSQDDLNGAAKLKLQDRVRNFFNSCIRRRVMEAENLNLRDRVSNLFNSCNRQRAMAAEHLRLRDRVRNLFNSCNRRAMAAATLRLRDGVRNLFNSCNRRAMAAATLRLRDRVRNLFNSCNRRAMAAATLRLRDRVRNLFNSCNRQRAMAAENWKLPDRVRNLFNSCNRQRAMVAENLKLPDRVRNLFNSCTRRRIIDAGNTCRTLCGRFFSLCGRFFTLCGRFFRRVRDHPLCVRFLHRFRQFRQDIRDRVDRLKKRLKPESKPLKPCCSWRLPWWFVIFSWLVLICTALTCSYFVMLYGLKFGTTRSMEWAVSFFTSFLTSALVTQPFKVLGLAVILTLILRFHVTSQYAQVKDKKKLEASIKKQKERGFEDFDSVAPLSLSKRGIEAIKDRIRMEWGTQELLRELLFYFSFVAVLIIVAHGHKHVDTCYRATKSVEDMFVHGTYSNNTQSFNEISTVDDMWDYITGTFIPNLYSIDQEEDESVSYPPLCADGVSLAVGLARIRQIRKKSEYCAGVVGYLPDFLGPCKSLDFYTTEDILSYSGPWVNGQVENDKVPPDKWTYQTGTQLSTLPYVGQYASYSGGGYAAEIPENEGYRIALLDSIQTNPWIDVRTSAIFIEFAIYNPGKNLFSVVILTLEFLGTGEILPFHTVYTTKLYHYGTNFETFVAVCEALFVVQIFWLAYVEIKKFSKIGRVAYFRDPWSYAEVLTLILCVTAVAMYLQRMVFVTTSIKQMKIKGRHAFVNFFTAAYWDFVLGYVLAFLVFLAIIKVFKLFRFNRKLTLLTSTMRIITMPLLRFAFMAAVYLMAFIHTGYLVFGRNLDSYKTTLSSALTLFNFAVGVSDYLGLYSVSNVIGPLFFILFVFGIQLILLNMLVTLILDGFSRARKKIVGQQNDYEVVDYMISQFSLAIGFHKLKKKFKDRTK